MGCNECVGRPTLQGLEMCVTSTSDGVGYLFLIYLKCLLSTALLDSLKPSRLKKFNHY